MSSAKSNWKALLLLVGILALSVGSSIPALAQKGVWWWGSTKHYGVTLINLTDYTLKLVSSQTSITTDYDCYPYPFERLGVNVKPYGSAVWASDESPVTILNYNGKMTFLPNGLDQKWAFTLNFRHQDASGAHAGHGTWVYLTPSDTANSADQWIDSWSSSTFSFGGYHMYLGYPTALNDGQPHNFMNLQGTDPSGIAVAVYSYNNSHVIMVVQQIDNTDPYNRTWKLNWADNNDDSMPH